MSDNQIKEPISKLANPEKAAFLQGYFKTGPGGYGEGDVFAGLTVPQCRKIAKSHARISKENITSLLGSQIHEERLIALLILVEQYRKASTADRKTVVDLYVRQRHHVNNWDLVDSSAPYILGDWLLTRNRKILYKLAKSDSLWDRRIAILSTFAFIKAGEFEDTFAIGEMLIHDPHDLIHKAVGWMLREVGKRIDIEPLRDFLATHATTMPRTALRYAIEKMPEVERKQWLQLKGRSV